MTTKTLSSTDRKRSPGLLTTGLALFSMFFGAGNLIFPMIVGKTVGANPWPAISGLSITAIIVPFLGLAAMILCKGDSDRFFGKLGRKPAWCLLILLQLILGPLGVIPRLITLMHATAASFCPTLPLMGTSIGIGLVIYLCSLDRSKLISFLGVILTPLLLLSLGGLLLFGIFTPGVSSSYAMSAGEGFRYGFVEGYNTMDLIAAFFFAMVILPHFQSELETKGNRRGVLKKVFLAGGIAAALLLLTYIGLCLISSLHALAIPADTPSEQMLGALAKVILGPIGALLASIAVFLACLTTAITLSSIFATYLKKDICKDKISNKTSLIVTILLAALFANLGFGGIAAFLGPLLQVIYPGLIVLALVVITGVNRAKLFVFSTFLISFMFYLLN